MDIQSHYLNKHSIIWSSLFFLLLIISYLIYSPSISGIFIFDDIPNLSPLGKYSNLGFWDNFWLFILEGNSGPTGRPISLASFFLNDINWSLTLPASFITTNIFIHLLNGVLVFWFCLKLTNVLGFLQKQQAGYSLLITALWLLHPMQTTAVVYVIQRMTELSAMFMLIGLIFFLYGRELLAKNIKKGLFILFIGVGFSLLLAILSKENGILLVAYILVIEFFLLQPFKQLPPNKYYYWLIPAIIIPFIAIIVYLGLITSQNNFADRDFTLTERLLTEPRILFDYLYHIFIPDMSYTTLYHDDYKISKNLLSPWTTLLSIFGIALLFVLSFKLRKKTPLIAFAIAWFFAGHLIESTVLPLELYFEHRNYLPMLGIFIAIALLATSSIYKKAILGFVSFFLIINSFFLYLNTSLWGNPLALGISWFKSHPQSERSRLLYVSVTNAAGIKKPLIKSDKPISKENSLFYSTSALLELKKACSNNKISTDILSSTINTLRDNVIHISAKTRFMEFVNEWRSGKCSSLKVSEMIPFLLNLTELENIKKHHIFSHDIHLALSGLYRINRNFQETMNHLDRAYIEHPTVELLITKAEMLASAGLYKEALRLLNDTSLLESRGLRGKVILAVKQKKIDQLKNVLKKKI